jgi:glycosyltransferase involved in cell wall biosynthesis
MAPRLFAGITTWNSAAFLPHSLAALRRNTDERDTRMVVLDNFSTDATISIARDFGAEVIRRYSSQAAALADLFNLSHRS